MILPFLYWRGPTQRPSSPGKARTNEGGDTGRRETLRAFHSVPTHDPFSGSSARAVRSASSRAAWQAGFRLAQTKGALYVERARNQELIPRPSASSFAALFTPQSVVQDERAIGF